VFVYNYVAVTIMFSKRTPRVNLAKHNADVAHDQASAAHKTADEAKKAAVLRKTADRAEKAAAAARVNLAKHNAQVAHDQATAAQKTADEAKKAAVVRKTADKAEKAAAAAQKPADNAKKAAAVPKPLNAGTANAMQKNHAVEGRANEAAEPKKKAKDVGKVQKQAAQQAQRALYSHAEASDTSPDAQYSGQGTLPANDSGAPKSQASADSGILSLGNTIRENISNIMAQQGPGGHPEIDTTESDEDENVLGCVFEETSQETSEVSEVSEEEEGEEGEEAEASSAVDGKIDTTGFPADWPLLSLYANSTVMPVLAPDLMQDMSEMPGGIAILLAGSILAKMEVSEGVSRIKQTMIRLLKKWIHVYHPVPAVDEASGSGTTVVDDPGKAERAAHLRKMLQTQQYDKTVHTLYALMHEEGIKALQETDRLCQFRRWDPPPGHSACTSMHMQKASMALLRKYVQTPAMSDNLRDILCGPQQAESQGPCV